MRLTTLDAHVGGAAIRLVTAGVPTLGGRTMAERQRSFERRADRVRTLLCREPRGHAGVIGVVLTEPERPEGDAGLLFFHGRGYAPLRAEAAIGAAHLAVRHGLLSLREARTHIEFDTVSGPLVVRRAGVDGEVAVATGPPAFVLHGGLGVQLASRTVRADVAWSGSEFLVIADAESAGAPLVPDRALELRRIGVALVEAVNERHHPVHPANARIRGASGAVFIGAPISEATDVRSAVVYGDGTLERSPSASATAAIVAVLQAMGMAVVGQHVRHEGLLGTSLRASIARIGTVESFPCCDIEVEGTPYETGQHVFIAEAADPLQEGLLLA